MTEVKKQTLPSQNGSTQGSLQKAHKVQFSTLIKSDKVQKALTETLGDVARAKTFTASVISAVNTNRALADCDGMSIISGALLGETLKLSPSPQLGRYYLVPFKDNKTHTTKATFQMGYKGYYELAMRSGAYKKITAISVKEGEFEFYDPFIEEFGYHHIVDPDERANAKTIGYYAFFELTNGFTKTIYWTKNQMEKHAEKYSMGYRAHKGYTFWEKDFDAMAIKTMYRQLLSKYGILSVEMQNALTNDMTIQPDITKEESSNDEEPVYFDTVIDAETGEVSE